MQKFWLPSLVIVGVTGLLLSVILYYTLLIKSYQKHVLAYVEAVLQQEQVDPQLLQKISQQTKKINHLVQKIAIADFSRYRPISADLTQVLLQLLNSKQRWLVLLQNSDELRATGGFMGSYLLIDNDHGQLQNIRIQDIYAPDGQFQGHIDAPPGLAEYLSSGQGMRLPDANWWFDLNTSSEQILYFFEQAGESNIETVLFLNLQLVEELLSFTGPVYLPDYQQEITASNFAELARADRADFFPGSQEKINFLNHFLVSWKSQFLAQLQQNPQTLLQLLSEQLAAKNLQVYSLNPELDQLTRRYHLNYTFQQQPYAWPFLSLESNVGINKVNRQVERQVQLKVSPEQEVVLITWDNQHQLPYVNYQRFYFGPNSKLQRAQLNQRVLQLDQDVRQSRLVDSQGQLWTEVALLVPVLAQQSSQLELVLESSSAAWSTGRLQIFKQAGMPPTPYQVTWHDASGQEQVDGQWLLYSDKIVSKDD